MLGIDERAPPSSGHAACDGPSAASYDGRAVKNGECHRGNFLNNSPHTATQVSRGGGVA